MSLALIRQLQQRFAPRGDSLTRREMLKLSLAGSAGLLCQHLAPAPACGRSAERGRVVVIGGGFGGLSAAHELVTVGYDVTVLEARRRLGGRVVTFTDVVPERFVDGGGELIGGNHPTWIAFAERFGLKFLDVTWGDVTAPIVVGGRRLSTPDTRQLWDEMQAGQNTLNAACAAIDAERPWEAADAAALDRRSLGDWIRELPVSPLCRQALTAQWTAINGMLPAWQSFLANLAMIKGGGIEAYWTETDTFRCAGGSQQLALKFAEAIGDERIRLGTPAAAVDQINDELLRVTLADGRHLEAEDVVLAVPASTWNRIAFTPALPAVLNLQMGNNVKYLAAVRGRFWKTEQRASRSLTDGPVSMSWEATENQPGDGPACLTLFSGGPAAEQCREWPAAERGERYVTALNDVFPQWKSQFINGRFVDWPADPWAKGSYSFPAPGQVTLIGPLLREGLGRLHFAGEYASAEFVGYMEGALSSGVRVAREIAERDGVLKPREQR